MVQRVQQFRDRYDAGRILAKILAEWANRPEVIVLGLPRGGVPVAAVGARVLNVELNICVVRKLGMPNNPELAIGAIASGGITVWVPESERFGISPAAMEQVRQREQQELSRREQIYRGDRPPPDLHNRVVILVDDGIATGATMMAAIAWVYRRHPRQTIVAAPIAARSTISLLSDRCNRVVCAVAPEPLNWVGAWYEYFAPVGDGEVCRLLSEFSVPLSKP